MDIDEDIRSKMEKCAAQFSTAFRTLSKVFALWGQNGPKSPETDSADDEKMDISETEFGNSAPFSAGGVFTTRPTSQNSSSSTFGQTMRRTL